MPRIVIFANGALPDVEATHALLKEDDYLIAADGGANHLMKIGILPEVLIGDLDSIDEDILFKLISAEIKIEQYPEDKDETDIELALRYAVELQPSAILIVGALGGRLDQTIANLSLLTHPMLAKIDSRLDDGVEEAFFCLASAGNGEQVQVRGRSEDIVSLIPWQAPVEGVVTEGLQWPLYGETLYPDKSRGVSNKMLSESASVKIEKGLLLIVHRRQPEVKS